ncbi:hypothetical protein E2C01_061800 [Portunus trituberculatus]|uniref:Uncharacterized protein n=1 Tax=Portunus trituberculatus TaxID=210409 RepID=A0A5B7HC01_PORTR|nr:hypothetical protein [Portunus trituberculatus]
MTTALPSGEETGVGRGGAVLRQGHLRVKEEGVEGVVVEVEGCHRTLKEGLYDGIIFHQESYVEC